MVTPVSILTPPTGGASGSPYRSVTCATTMRVAAELKQHREDTAKQFNRIEQFQIQSTLKVELEFVKDDIKDLGCRELPETATQFSTSGANHLWI
ncbi:MAG: hypothetical protein ACE5E2_02460 [Candidatus Binatia bacterium]